jgi:hypothetical protein
VRRRIGERPTLEPNVAQLLKLHGSVDWNRKAGHIERRADPDQPVLIYPAQTKFLTLNTRCLIWNAWRAFRWRCANLTLVSSSLVLGSAMSISSGQDWIHSRLGRAW